MIVRIIFLLLQDLILLSGFVFLHPPLGFCMFVLSLVKKHYRLQFYMVRFDQQFSFSRVNCAWIQRNGKAVCICRVEECKLISTYLLPVHFEAA